MSLRKQRNASLRIPDWKSNIEKETEIKRCEILILNEIICRNNIKTHAKRDQEKIWILTKSRNCFKQKRHCNKIFNQNFKEYEDLNTKNLKKRNKVYKPNMLFTPKAKTFYSEVGKGKQPM